MGEPQELLGSEAAVLAIPILRAGQSDSLRWWDDESLTDAGREALSRLFPRDHLGIAVRLALEAALARQQGVLASAGVTDVITLMDMAARALRNRLVNWRVPMEPVVNIEKLTSMLQRAMPGLGDLRPSAPVKRATLDLSEVANKGQPLAQVLASGYLRGEVGRLVIPFVQRSRFKQ